MQLMLVMYRNRRSRNVIIFNVNVKKVRTEREKRGRESNIQKSVGELLILIRIAQRFRQGTFLKDK